MAHPDRSALPVLDIEPEFREEFDRDLTELTGTLKTLVEQYRLLLRIGAPDQSPQTPDRAMTTIAKVGDRLRQSGVWHQGTAERVLSVAVRLLSDRGEFL